MSSTRREFLKNMAGAGLGLALASSSDALNLLPKPVEAQTPETQNNPELLGQSQLPAEIGRVDFFPGQEQQTKMDALSDEEVQQQITDQLKILFNQVKDLPNKDEVLNEELKNYQELTGRLLLLILKSRRTHGIYTTGISEETLTDLGKPASTEPTSGESPWFELLNLLDQNSTTIKSFQNDVGKGIDLSLKVDPAQMTAFCKAHPEMKILNASFEVGIYTMRFQFERKLEVSELTNKYYAPFNDEFYIALNPDGSIPEIGYTNTDHGVRPTDSSGKELPVFTEDQVDADIQKKYAENPYWPIESPKNSIIEPYATSRADIIAFAESVPNILVNTAGGNINSLAEFTEMPSNLLIVSPLLAGNYDGSDYNQICSYAEVYIPQDVLKKLSGSKDGSVIDSSSAATAVMTGITWRIQSEHPDWSPAQIKQEILSKYVDKRIVGVYVGNRTEDNYEGYQEKELPLLNVEKVREALQAENDKEKIFGKVRNMLFPRKRK